MHDQNFFVYQHKALRPLMGWGLDSSVVGAGLLLVPGFARHFGFQTMIWGLIDLYLAMVGRRRAVLKAEQVAQGDLDERTVLQQAEKFRNTLAFNAGLDLLYIAAGLALAKRYPDRPDRTGHGYGIVVQGAFLLAFDALVALDTDRRFLA